METDDYTVGQEICTLDGCSASEYHASSRWHGDGITRERSGNLTPIDQPPSDRRFREFEDPQYHDEVDTVPADEGQRNTKRFPVRTGQMPRRPPRRHYEDD